jgi:CD2 antigen cytoplasmic tail-binding protein 2
MICTSSKSKRPRRRLGHVDPYPSRSSNSDKSHQSAFARLNDLISSLTALGHLDVYSMTREAMQRMLPPDAPSAAPSTSQNPSRPISDTLQPGRTAPNTRPIPTDTRAFEYRFSKKYLASLPEGQRPLERDVFGKSPNSLPSSLNLTDKSS